MIGGDKLVYEKNSTFISSKCLLNGTFTSLKCQGERQKRKTTK